MNRDLFWLTDEQFSKVSPHLPADTRGKAHVDDRRVISGIVFVRSLLGVFSKIFPALASKGQRPERLMIGATRLKAHRTAASLLTKRLFNVVSGAPKVA
jgi:putative transposase